MQTDFSEVLTVLITDDGGSKHLWNVGVLRVYKTQCHIHTFSITCEIVVSVRSGSTSRDSSPKKNMTLFKRRVKVKTERERIVAWYGALILVALCFTTGTQLPFTPVTSHSLPSLQLPASGVQRTGFVLRFVSVRVALPYSLLAISDSGSAARRRRETLQCSTFSTCISVHLSLLAD
jgi:hypothetical protein